MTAAAGEDGGYGRSGTSVTLRWRRQRRCKSTRPRANVNHFDQIRWSIVAAKPPSHVNYVAETESNGVRSREQEAKSLHSFQCDYVEDINRVVRHSRYFSANK